MTISRKHHEKKKLQSGSLICLSESVSVCVCPLISHQRAESSRLGSTGGSRRSIFTSLPRSLFLSGRVFQGVAVRSLLRVPPARGNSLPLRINHTDAPRHLGEQGGGRGVYTARVSVCRTGNAQPSDANSILKWQENKMDTHRDKGDLLEVKMCFSPCFTAEALHAVCRTISFCIKCSLYISGLDDFEKTCFSIYHYPVIVTLDTVQQKLHTIDSLSLSL